MIRLAFQEFKPRVEVAKKPPLVILHGLFGSKQNWRSLSKALADSCKTRVISMDLRNHGESPWTMEQITYKSMAEDVAKTMKEIHEGSFDVIGHSMGGKVAMSLSSLPGTNHLVRRMVIVDMTTRVTPLTGSFMRYVEAMKRLDGQVASKKEAEQLLLQVEPNKSVTQFLLTNLVPFEELSESAKKLTSRQPLNLRIRVNLDAILKSPKEIGQVVFSLPHEGRPEKSLFIYGTKADYVTEDDKIDILEHYPDAEFKAVDAGHWVHAEKPQEFQRIVAEFINSE